MRYALELVPACRVNMRLYILMPLYLLHSENVQVMQMLSVPHGENSGVESDVIPPVKVVNHRLVLCEDLLRQTKAEIRPVAALLILRLHLDHNAGAVVGEVDRVLLVQTHPYDVPVPAYTLILVYSIEFGHRLVRVVHETIEAAVPPVVSPGQPGDRPHLVVVARLCQDEHVDR